MQTTVSLSSLDLELAQQGWGSPRADLSVDKNPLSIGGVRYESGFGTHADSALAVQLAGVATRFRAVVGVDDEVGDKGSVEFAVVGDGKTLWRSGVVRGGEAGKRIDVDVRGLKRLVLTVAGGDDGIDYDHANWADAVFELAAGANAGAIRATTLATGGDLPIAKRHTGPEPRINGPSIVGGTPGREFLFRIPASGARPMRFEAHGLPQGLNLDSDTGIISGTVPPEGNYKVALTALNDHGRAERELAIVSGIRKLALTPPMGWNSWNVWGTSIDVRKTLAAAQAFIDTGLADYGYAYVNIDDGWEAGRNAAGEIQANDKFPDMKKLCDQVHAMGLKIGIYSSPGPKTCAGYEGSYMHEAHDARSYAAWGFDYLKYDWCSYGQIAKDKSLHELQKPYRLMREMLDRVDRDIVYSLCQYGMGEVWKWGEEIGADLWRTTGDIVDTWQSMSTLGFGELDRNEKIGPGNWNDPDMMVFGHVGWGPNVRPTRLSRNEQVTHMTIWAMLPAPILLGNDLERMDEFTKDLLMNAEVLDVHQDPMGKPARLLRRTGDIEAWVRGLHDGSLAVAVFNRGYEEAKATVSLLEIGVAKPSRVRDLWTGADIPLSDVERLLPGHGAIMLRVWR